MKRNMIPFKSKGLKKEDGSVVDHGDLGSLQYEVFSRGVIHIFDGKRTFKKDCNILQDELENIDFRKLDENKEIQIDGSGDNDHLVFKKKDGEIEVCLRERGIEVINKLKSILRR